MSKGEGRELFIYVSTNENVITPASTATHRNSVTRCGKFKGKTVLILDAFFLYIIIF